MSLHGMSSLSFLGLHMPSSKVRTGVKGQDSYILNLKPLSTECVFIGKEVLEAFFLGGVLSGLDFQFCPSLAV